MQLGTFWGMRMRLKSHRRKWEPKISPGIWSNIPGAIFRLGIRGREGTDFELHHPNFDIDDRALAVGVKVFCWSAIRLFFGQFIIVNVDLF